MTHKGHFKPEVTNKKHKSARCLVVLSRLEKGHLFPVLEPSQEDRASPWATPAGIVCVGQHKLAPVHVCEGHGSTRSSDLVVADTF